MADGSIRSQVRSRVAAAISVSPKLGKLSSKEEIKRFKRRQKSALEKPYKPDSVPHGAYAHARVLISLGRELPRASSNLPGDLGRAGLSAGLLRAPQASPYLVLLRTTLTVPLMSPSPRWALTPPFHPYLSRCHEPRFIASAIGGLFSVVLVSDLSAWTLSSVLALGVRTFLPSILAQRASTRAPQRAPSL